MSDEHCSVCEASASPRARRDAGDRCPSCGASAAIFSPRDGALAVGAELTQSEIYDESRYWHDPV